MCYHYATRLLVNIYRQEEPDDDDRRYEVSYRWLAGVTAALVISVTVLLLGGQIHVSQFKPISYARDFPDAKEVYHSFGPTGEFQVFKSSYFHFAPGLSDNAGLNLSNMPENAYEGLYIDGEGPIGIMRKLRPAEEGYLDYLPMAAPYLVTHNPRVLLLGLGGGTGVFDALYHSAGNVTVVEADSALRAWNVEKPPTTAHFSRPYLAKIKSTTSSLRSCGKSMSMSGSLFSAMRSWFRKRRK